MGRGLVESRPRRGEPRLFTLRPSNQSYQLRRLVEAGRVDAPQPGASAAGKTFYAAVRAEQMLSGTCRIGRGHNSALRPDEVIVPNHIDRPDIRQIEHAVERGTGDWAKRAVKRTGRMTTAPASIPGPVLMVNAKARAIHQGPPGSGAVPGI